MNALTKLRTEQRAESRERERERKEEAKSEQAQINFVIYVRIDVLAATLIFYLFNLLSRNHRLFVSRLWAVLCCVCLRIMFVVFIVRYRVKYV